MEPNQNDRNMVQGKWKCAGCGKVITELPFEPTADRPIYCRDCWAAKRPSGPRRDFGPRKMFQGNWKCAECGKVITELPFQPNPDQPVHCRECWAKKRDER